MGGAPSPEPAESHILDHDKVRAVVDDYWRNLILDAQAGRVAMAAQRLTDFETKVRRWAAEMPPADAAAFVVAVEAERIELADLYDRSPEAAYRRLRIPSLPGLASSGPRIVVIRQSAGCGSWLVVVAVVTLALVTLG